MILREPCEPRGHISSSASENNHPLLAYRKEQGFQHFLTPVALNACLCLSHHAWKIDSKGLISLNFCIVVLIYYIIFYRQFIHKVVSRRLALSLKGACVAGPSWLGQNVDVSTLLGRIRKAHTQEGERGVTYASPESQRGARNAVKHEISNATCPRSLNCPNNLPKVHLAPYASRGSALCVGVRWPAGNISLLRESCHGRRYAATLPHSALLPSVPHTRRPLNHIYVNLLFNVTLLKDVLTGLCHPVGIFNLRD